MGILSKLPFFKYGTIDYQVNFYIKKYASLLQQGFSKNDALKWLMEFYLQGESGEKRFFMNDRFNNYYNQIDLLVYDIMIFYFYYDDKKRRYSIEDIRSDTQHYLIKYKSLYNIQ
jgi:hypothetical protein